VFVHIHTVPLVPSDLFDRVDDDWCDYGGVQGVATRYCVLGPVDGSAYYVVPQYNGGFNNSRSVAHIYKVEAERFDGNALGRSPAEVRSFNGAYSNAAFQAALGIANALAAQQVLIESA
jgi:hypothetical protein